MNNMTEKTAELEKTDRQRAETQDTIGDEDNTVFFEQDLAGRPCPVVHRKGRDWRLSSAYDTEYAAAVFYEKRINLKPYGVMFLFGSGDGRVVNKIWQSMDETNVLVVYEPNHECFDAVFKKEACKQLLEDNRILFILGGNNDQMLDALVGGIITYNNFQLVDMQILPQYDILYPEECRNLIDIIIYYQKKVILNRNTEINENMKLTENILFNMFDYVKQSNLYLLKKQFCTENLTDVPAIIVSAGPSLDKNIEELKRAEGKAFIIGVDAALKALVRHGIKVQLGITVDPAKDLSLFEEDAILDIPFVLENYSTKGIVEKHRARHFYSMGYGSEYLNSVCEPLAGYKNWSLKTGGSVATQAFSLADELGFQTIILIGQDLAFTGGRGHVSDVCSDEEENRNHVKKRMLTEVPDINGNMVKTDIQMSVYLEWFAKEAFRVRDHIKVIDATEGGARIENTEVMSLREAVEKYCVKDMDLDQIINSTPDTFTEVQRAGIYRQFVRIPEELSRIAEILEKNLDKYEEVRELAERPDAGKEDFRKAMEGIEDIDELKSREPLLTLVAQYNQKTEYMMAEGVYEREDIGIAELAERSAAIIKGYINGIGEFRKDLPILLDQIPKKAEDN